MTQEIQPDAPCCDVFPQIAHNLSWFVENSRFMTLPYLRCGADKWRVNFCPACGKPLAGKFFSRETVYGEPTERTR